MPPIRRTMKNVIKNYTDAQVKVREATSNDPWNPSSTLMSEISHFTYNVVAYTEIMQIVWKRLNDHGKNWRHVYKSLVLLDYIIKTGSEKVAQQCRENIFVIETLKDFQYVDDAKDHGAGIREKAKQLVLLLKDDERLKNERAKALKAKERVAQSVSAFGSNTTSPTMLHTSSSYGDSFATTKNDNTSPPELDSVRPSDANEEDLQLQLAIAMSKEAADEEDRKRKGDDVKLQMAIDESKKELERQQQSRHVKPPNAEADLFGLNLPAANDEDSEFLSPKFKAYLFQSEENSNTWGATNSSSTNGNKKLEPAFDAKPQSDPWSPLAVKNDDPWTSSNSNTIKEDNWNSIGVENRNIAQSNSLQNFDDSNLFGLPANSDNIVNSNSFDLTSMNDNLPLQSISPSNSGTGFTKSPESFLGEHSKLVNMDNLVSRPTPSPVNTNPFSALVSGTVPVNNARNPFAQQVAPKVPMNQMSRNSPSFQFNLQQNHQQMPAPLIPLGGDQNSTSKNPFL